jgi:hypothetical protein
MLLVSKYIKRFSGKTTFINLKYDYYCNSSSIPHNKKELPSKTTRMPIPPKELIIF